jgi:hypothetical protein
LPFQTGARRGDWMQTYSGRTFWPLDPKASEVYPVDIAHALSQLCRFGGHTSRFYSVAEHCVLMSQAVAPEHALWALLHDATEAYVCDVPRPIKPSLTNYSEIERRVMDSICIRFNLPFTEPAEVKDADHRILLTERAALLTQPPLTWGDDLESLEPLPVIVQALSPRAAERAYLDRFAELGITAC